MIEEGNLVKFISPNGNILVDTLGIVFEANAEWDEYCINWFKTSSRCGQTIGSWPSSCLKVIA